MRIKAGLVLALCCVTAARADAVEPPAFLQMVAVSPESGAGSPADTHWSIFLDGVIDEGAPGRLAGFLSRRDVAGAIVYLNSPGGSLAAAMAVGRILRAAGYETRVGARAADSGRIVAAACYGACPFALAGGTRRGLEPGSTIGVQRIESRVPAQQETVEERRTRFESLNYLAEMGIDAGLVDLMAEVPYQATRPLTPEEARQVRLID